jgi:hypothetical protein
MFPVSLNRSMATTPAQVVPTKNRTSTYLRGNRKRPRQDWDLEWSSWACSPAEPSRKAKPTYVNISPAILEEICRKLYVLGPVYSRIKQYRLAIGSEYAKIAEQDMSCSLGDSSVWDVPTWTISYVISGEDRQTKGLEDLGDLPVGAASFRYPKMRTW